MPKEIRLNAFDMNSVGHRRETDVGGGQSRPLSAPVV
jgi:hypothetical protein